MWTWYPVFRKYIGARTLEEVNKIIENVLDKMQEEKKRRGKKKTAWSTWQKNWFMKNTVKVI